MKIIDMIKNKQVHFKFYRGKILYYETEDEFLFEVPIEDTGTGVFNATDKASFFMRWIRKQLEKNDEAKLESKT